MAAPSYNMFIVNILNTANVTTAVYDEYKAIIYDAFTKWETITTGVKNVAFSNFKIRITVDIAVLGQGTLGSTNVEQIYDTNYTSGVSVTTTSLPGKAYGTTLFPYKATMTLSSTEIVRIKNIVAPSGKTHLYYVVLHEIGHALGIGPFWMFYQYGVTNAPLALSGGTLYYQGVNALREYRNAFNNQNLIVIPLENNGGNGTMNVHLEEGTENGMSRNNRVLNGILHPGLDQELMTGWAEDASVDMPLSKITCGLLDDLGYVVNYNNADGYNYPISPWTTDIAITAKIGLDTSITLLGNTYVQGVNLTYAITRFPTYGSATLTPGSNTVNCLITAFVTQDSFEYVAYYIDSDGNEIISEAATVTLNMTNEYFSNNSRFKLILYNSSASYVFGTDDVPIIMDAINRWDSLIEYPASLSSHQIEVFFDISDTLDANVLGGAGPTSIVWIPPATGTVPIYFGTYITSSGSAEFNSNQIQRMKTNILYGGKTEYYYVPTPNI